VHGEGEVLEGVVGEEQFAEALELFEALGQGF